MKFFNGYEFTIGYRYTRSKSKNNFVSFISIISILGISLGVASLIIVMSVMNGFQNELRQKILGVVSHVQIQGVGSPMNEWPIVDQKVKNIVNTEGTAPYLSLQGLLTKDSIVRGVVVRGIEPLLEKSVSQVANNIVEGDLSSLNEGEFNIILGKDLAEVLQVTVQDKLLFMVPRGQVTAAGIMPRLKMFKVSGIFEAGMYNYDAGFAMIHLRDAQSLMRLSKFEVDGLRVKLKDLFSAPKVVEQLVSGGTLDTFSITDWTQSHRNFFKAVQIEKKVMFIILLLVVGVATFNIVSTLVMAVGEKNSDIAILRTLGASPRSIMGIFLIQGTLIGLTGTFLGTALGVLVAVNIDAIFPAIETIFGTDLLSKDVYYISELPSKLEIWDVIMTVSLSVILSIFATLYPSWRASQVRPAEALRHE